MPEILEVARGDTLPALEGALRYEGTAAVNLTGSTVTATFRRPGPEPVTPPAERAVAIVDAVTGKVRYDLQAADTATAGTWWVRFHVVFANGKRMSFPPKDFVQVVVS